MRAESVEMAMEFCVGLTVHQAIGPVNEAPGTVRAFTACRPN